MTDSFAPNVPLRETVYCGVVPSSLAVGPAIDQSAGPSATPPGPWVSLMVVVTLAAIATMLTDAPLVLV